MNTCDTYTSRGLKASWITTEQWGLQAIGFNNQHGSCELRLDGINSVVFVIIQFKHHRMDPASVATSVLLCVRGPVRSWFRYKVLKLAWMIVELRWALKHRNADPGIRAQFQFCSRMKQLVCLILSCLISKFIETGSEVTASARSTELWDCSLHCFIFLCFGRRPRNWSPYFGTHSSDTGTKWLHGLFPDISCYDIKVSPL